jgi:glycine cleavage system H lipoate-binding protein
MDVRFENFLGRDLIIPDDRSYYPAEGLWIKKEDDGSVAVGLTEPTVLMAGMVREVEFLVEEGSTVRSGETIVLALTAKLKYIAAPLSGMLVCPRELGQLPHKLMEDPYGTVLFNMIPQGEETGDFFDAAGYSNALKDSDGARNPGGNTGGVSPTCKAVYMGIGDQSIKKQD